MLSGSYMHFQKKIQVAGGNGSMPKKIKKASMTNCSSFELENVGHACHFDSGAWVSKFCHGFSNPLGTFS